jgi:hypothetical protein
VNADGGAALIQAIVSRVTALFAPFDITVVAGAGDPNAAVVNQYFAINASTGLYGTSTPGGGVDLNKTAIQNYLLTYNNNSTIWQGLQLDQFLNANLPGLVYTIDAGRRGDGGSGGGDAAGG